MKTRTCQHCSSEFRVRPNQWLRYCSAACTIKAQVTITATGCWEWTGSKNQGYGVIPKARFGEGMVHRLSYQTFKLPIRDGLIVRHDCDNPPCCNPDHLRTGTMRENSHDALRRDRGLGRTKLTVEEVKAIYASTERTRVLSRRYRVGDTAITEIRTGQTWATVTGHTRTV